MEKIIFKLQHKMKELASQMKPADYAQIQTWETFRNKINEIVDWINEQTKDTKRLWINLIDTQKEVLKISRWIKEHDKGDLNLPLNTEENPEKSNNPKATIAGKPEVTRYELSHDGVGLVAFLGGAVSYHIHSDELTPEQVSIRKQLLEMEGR